MLGVGVMLNYLGGNEETAKAVKSSIGKKISSFELKDDKLILSFSDKTELIFSDEGQSCCEHRYMTTNDDLTNFVGGKFVEAELRDGTPSTDEYSEEHEIQFLVIKTDKGNATVETHNKHNGYYGGFSICARN